MTPHERILKALNSEPVDRYPIDIWHTPEILESLKQYTGESDELKLYQKLGIDKIVWLWPTYQHDQSASKKGETLNPWGVPTRTQRSGLATYEEFGEGLLADYEEPEELDDYALDRIENIQTAMLERCFEELGDQLGMVFISDDMGTQESQQISIPAYERHLKLRLKRWCDLIMTMARRHSC
jgi:hypothetical protein